MKFRSDLPEFVGSDMHRYGPFKNGEVTSLPDNEAGILVKKGIAENTI